MKMVWITALGKDTEKVGNIMSGLGKYGLDCNGAFFTDDLDQMGWLEQADQLIQPDTSLWILLGTGDEIAKKSVAYGISLLTLYIRSHRRVNLPMMWITPDQPVPSNVLPAILKDVDQYRMENSSYPVKAVAKANIPPGVIAQEYRIGVYAQKSYGVWFEVGPLTATQWTGAMFGADTGEIDFHAVGTAGQLPEKSMLEYPQKGILLKSGEHQYNAWAVQNHLDEHTSYFVRLRGIPSRILFGPNSSDSETEVTILQLS